MRTYHFFTLLALFTVNHWRTELLFLHTATDDKAWVTFESQLNYGQVYLQWETQLDKRPKGFEIERSRDALNYEAIGKISGKTDNNKQQYRYRDVLPLPGKLYYRLRMVDAAGTSTYSDIAIIENPAEPSSEFQLRSNPTAFTLYFPVTTQGKTVVRLLAHDGTVAHEEELAEGIESWGLIWADGLNSDRYLMQIVLRGRTFYHWIEKARS